MIPPPPAPMIPPPPPNAATLGRTAADAIDIENADHLRMVRAQGLGGDHVHQRVAILNGMPPAPANRSPVRIRRGIVAVLQQIENNFAPMPIPRTRMLTGNASVRAMKQYYETGNMLTLPRCQSTMTPLYEILNSRFRYAAIHYVDGGRLPDSYIASYHYCHSTPSLCADPNNRQVFLKDSADATIRYLHVALSVQFSTGFGNIAIVHEAKKKLRTLKVGIAAYAIYALINGYDCVFRDRRRNINTLHSYKTSNEMLFYCYILPLVTTISLLMDNSEKVNLTVSAILDQNLDSFTRATMKGGMSIGLWSVAHLQAMAHTNIGRRDIGIISSGVEFNIARVFMMLTNSIENPEPINCFVTQLEMNQMLGRLPINQHVVHRAVYL
jgi:hypothetical protein